MAMRARVAREEEPHRGGGRASKAREPHARLPDRDAVADPRLVGQLPGAQLQRMAETIQGSLGNQETAALLRSVQRAPAPSAPATSAPETSRGSSQVTISILTARLVAKPSFIARTIVELSRGDVVTLTGEQKGGWHRVVTAHGDAGWLHQSAWATSSPKLTSTPGRGGSGPPEEIEIGGRG